MSTGIGERTKLIAVGLWLGFLPLASADLPSLSHAQQPEAKPRVIKRTPFAISGEDVEGVTLSPDGSEIAVVGSQLLPSKEGNQGDRNLFLDIWSIEKAKRIARLQLSSVPYSLLAGVPQPETRFGDRFIRYTSNGKMIVLYDGEGLRVVKCHPDATYPNVKEGVSVELKEISSIPLDLGSPQNDTLVQSMEVAGDGTRAALEICNPRQGSAQTVRVYDLASRSILRQWKFETGCVFSGYSPISWDPKGSRLAVSLPENGGASPHRLPFIRSKSHLYILDVTSSKILNDIRTGYIAGPVCFSTNDTVLTASLNADSGYFREDTIREWNVATGRRMRDLESVPQGVHSLLHLSADGNLILAYIGREKPVEHFLENDYLEFGLWDNRTGKLITTSGHVERPQPANVLEHRVGPIPSFGSWSDRILLADSGSRVLIWWHQSSRPFLIYDVPSAE